eukprot:TRINITY_DN5878_c0_g1_i17.p1 TRINITY_DN5878_c0_g1~~TRINITY_DN5878_c0_g1_i17.p1  ORF type:complete len:223 (-),score=54.80 TRINITY_DN5878_c0_g1_i17:1148-1816(-)
MKEMRAVRCLSCGWSLEEYKKACEDPVFFHSVKQNLGFEEKDETKDKTKDETKDKTKGKKKEEENEKGDKTKEQLLDRKFFYAGFSTRWMFFFSVKEVESEVATIMRKLHDPSVVLQGLQGTGDSTSVSHLFSLFVNEHGEYNLLVSPFVIQEITKRDGRGFIKAATTYCIQLQDKGVCNGSFDGWIFQFDFLNFVEKLHYVVVFKTKDESERWTFPVCIAF